MKAIEKKRRKTIQEITIARRKNAAGMGEERGIRVLRKSKKKSTIAAIKDSQAADESGTRSIESYGPESEQPTKESKNRLLATVKRRKKRSCASCWGG